MSFRKYRCTLFALLATAILIPAATAQPGRTTVRANPESPRTQPRVDVAPDLRIEVVPPPRRNSSLGNGLFYGSDLETSKNALNFGIENAAQNQAARHAIHVNAYNGAASDYDVDYAGAWNQDDDSAFLHELSIDISTNQYWNELTSQYLAGFRPISVSGHRTANGSRFTVAWIRDNYAHEYDVIVDQNSNTYQEQVDEKVGLGFRLICASGYSHSGGAPRFSALLVKDGLTGWVARHGLHINDYQGFIDEWWPQGYRPISLTGYTVGSETYVTAVLVKDTSGANWVARHGLTASSLAAENAIWTDADHAQNSIGEELRPSIVSAYEYQGRKRYFGVWQTAGTRSFRKTGTHQPLLTAFDNAMRDHMQDYDVPAASIAVSKNGEIKLFRGYTWAPEGVRKTLPYYRFRIGSSSKTLTATAVMMLIEENWFFLKKSGGTELLNLDTEVFDMVGMPDMPFEYGSLPRFLTVRDLLRHVAGWDYNVYFALGNDIDQASAMGVAIPLTRDDKMSFMFDDPSIWPVPNNPASVGYVHPPDASWSYANIHFSILATMIETLTGKTYEEFVDEKILTPVGAHSTQIGFTARLLGHANEVTYSCDQPYTSDTNPGSGSPVVQSVVGVFAEPGPAFSTKAYGRFNIQTIDSTGGWVTTTADMVRFLRSFDGYDPFDPLTDTELLAHDSVWEMWSNFDNKSDALDYRYYLGWQAYFPVPSNDGPGNMIVQYHGGAVDGGYAIVCRRPDGICISAFFSRTRAGAGGWGTGIRGILNSVASGIAQWPEGEVTP